RAGAERRFFFFSARTFLGVTLSSLSAGIVFQRKNSLRGVKGGARRPNKNSEEFSVTKRHRPGTSVGATVRDGPEPVAVKVRASEVTGQPFPRQALSAVPDRHVRRARPVPPTHSLSIVGGSQWPCSRWKPWCCVASPPCAVSPSICASGPAAQPI